MEKTNKEPLIKVLQNAAHDNFYTYLNKLKHDLYKLPGLAKECIDILFEGVLRKLDFETVIPLSSDAGYSLIPIFPKEYVSISSQLSWLSWQDQKDPKDSGFIIQEAYEPLNKAISLFEAELPYLLTKVIAVPNHDLKWYGESLKMVCTELKKQKMRPLTLTETISYMLHSPALSSYRIKNNRIIVKILGTAYSCHSGKTHGFSIFPWHSERHQDAWMLSRSSDFSEKLQQEEKDYNSLFLFCHEEDVLCSNFDKAIRK